MTEIDKKVDHLELELQHIKEKCIEFEKRIHATDAKHATQCHFITGKADLMKSLDDIKIGINEKIKNVKDNSDNEFEYINEKVDSQKGHFYKILAVYSTVIMFILGIGFSMQTNKVSSHDYDKAFQSLYETIEKSVNNQEKMIDEMTSIKINVGILASKVDSLEKSTKAKKDHE